MPAKLVTRHAFTTIADEAQAALDLAIQLAQDDMRAVLFFCSPTYDLDRLGGSAGDDLRFERTAVYHDGRFLSDAALFVHFRTSEPFVTFKVQHFVPTAQKLVITDADPERRMVREINGMPAGQAYAELVGID